MSSRDAHDGARSPRARLVRLEDSSDYRLADGEPDVRGWPVVTDDGARVATVSDVLIDRARGEIGGLLVHAKREGRDIALSLDDVEVDDDAHAIRVRRFDAGAPASEVEPGAAHIDGRGVTVERTADGEEVVRVPIVEERLVVERRPVVKEVLLIRKRQVAEPRVVEGDVRKERFHIDDRRERDKR
jgi:sporulation protein YlmC with PRC-barrel domain